MTSQKIVTGIELRAERIRAGVLRQEDLAAAIGCSRQRISQIERMAEVKPQWVARYRRGLARLAGDADEANQ